MTNHLPFFFLHKYKIFICLVFVLVKYVRNKNEKQQ